MRRIWERYRRLRVVWQVVIVTVFGLVVVAAAASPAEDETPVATGDAAGDGAIEDLLPFASTTTTAELATTTTAAPTTTTAELAATTTTTAAPTTTTTAPPPPPPPTTVVPAPRPMASGCHPSYDPCVPVASDVDCAGGGGNGPAYTGRVSVIGPDEYDLDRDGNGVGCE